MSGTKTPQYERVKNNYSGIIRQLRVDSKRKDSLVDKFVDKGWIDNVGDYSEKELVNVALGRIQLDAKEFNTFYDILKEVTGMELIVKTLDTPGMATIYLGEGGEKVL